MLQRCGRGRGRCGGGRNCCCRLSIDIRLLVVAAAVEDLAKQLVDASLEEQFLMEVHVLHLGAQTLQEGIIKVQASGGIRCSRFHSIVGSSRLCRRSREKLVELRFHTFPIVLTSLSLADTSATMRRLFLGG